MKKILIVEYNRELRENTAEILKLENYEILVTDTGRRGIELALKHHPDMIISDVAMPDMPDSYMHEALIKYPPLKKTPIIFLMSKPVASVIDHLHTYFFKPFNVDELLKTISEKLVGSSGAIA